MSAGPASEEPKRLRPKTDVLRQLYLYSGNRCAFPGCSNPLLNDDGTLWGDIAHIEGVFPPSARHNPSMSNDERRSAPNLLLLCDLHHGTVDNPELVEEYTVEVVRNMKSKHEAKYRDAIAALSGKIGDATVGVDPVYPQNLSAMGYDPEDDEDGMNLALVCDFADKLATVPPTAREVLALILIHGKIAKLWLGQKQIEISLRRLEFTAKNVSTDDLYALVRILMGDGLIEVVEYEDETETEPLYVTSGSTPTDIGWDIFADLKELAKDDRTIIERVIIDLDFSVLEQ